MTDASRIRVVLADDHALLVEGLRSLIEAEPDMTVVAAVNSGEHLMEAIKTLAPDVVALDLEMGAMSGLACLERIRAESLPVKVLVLTAYSDGASMRAAIEGGAEGYALKTDPPRQTVQCIRQVYRGQLVFPLAAKRLVMGTAPKDQSSLTDREREILALVAEGATNATIAARIRVSENTVKFHLQNLYLKLGVSNRTEAAAYYHRHQPKSPPHSGSSPPPKGG